MTKNRKKIISLYERNPHCYWCGRKVKIHISYSKRQDPLSSTLDHLVSKNYWERHIDKSLDNKVVLSCYECNHGRTERENRIINEVFNKVRLSPFKKLIFFLANIKIEEKYGTEK